MILYIGLSIFFGWLLFLTFLVFSSRRHYFTLIGKTRKERIDELLESLIHSYSTSQQEINELKLKVDNVIKEAEHHLQKVNVVRFTPFERSGDQSFVIAVLDKKKNGAIINFMYTPDGLRVYTKKVKDGKGEEYQLSDEEQKAVAAS